MIAQKLIDTEQLKKVCISNEDVIHYFQGEIQKCLDAIKAKEDTVQQIQKQIETDRLQIAEFQKLIENLSVKKEEME